MTARWGLAMWSAIVVAAACAVGLLIASTGLGSSAFLAVSAGEARAAGQRLATMGEMGAAISEARRAADAYALNADPDAEAAVNSQVAIIVGGLDTLARTSNSDDVGATWTAVSEYATAYADAFSLVVARNGDVDASQRVLRRAWSEVEGALTEVLIVASTSGDADATYRAGAALSAASQASMYAERFQADGDPRHVEALEQAVTDSRGHLETLARRLPGAQRQLTFQRGYEALGAYAGAFSQMRGAWLARESLLNDRLSTAGVRLAEIHAEERDRLTAQSAVLNEAGLLAGWRLVIFAAAACGVLILILAGAGAWAARLFWAHSRRVADAVAAAARDGDFETTVASVPGPLNAITAAAENLRASARTAKELQVEYELQALEAERANSDMLIALSEAFNQVVDAAVGGDLSARVDTDFELDALNTLAQSINELLASVDGNIADASAAVAALAAGDLSQRMGGARQGVFAELQSSVNKTADSLSTMVDKLTSAAQSLDDTSRELTSGVDDLADRTAKQAATIEETSAAMEQLADTVKQNAGRAGQARTDASRAQETAEEGGAVMRDATHAIDRIATSSAKISEIIGLIDNIAFQTNLLALNASVEAARAGEAGKGFAVVASEVRRLAQSAAEASQEVKALILTSEEEVRTGVELVARASESLTAIVHSVRDVTSLMNAIADDSNEQASSLEEVNVAVRQLDQMTQHNAALVEETNAAIAQTASQTRAIAEVADGLSSSPSASMDTPPMDDFDDEESWAA